MIDIHTHHEICLWPSRKVDRCRRSLQIAREPRRSQSRRREREPDEDAKHTSRRNLMEGKRQLPRLVALEVARRGRRHDGCTLRRHRRPAELCHVFSSAFLFRTAPPRTKWDRVGGFDTSDAPSWEAPIRCNRSPSHRRLKLLLKMPRGISLRRWWPRTKRCRMVFWRSTS